MIDTIYYYIFSNYRPVTGARLIQYTVTDINNGTSLTAVCHVTFTDIDDTPLIDLNGLQSNGVNSTVMYIEGTDYIQVRLIGHN